ncbi:hypothetical protein E4099_02450 [Streptomyces palmae]|uniref:carbonic anhydrase n=1 Tax=Streptomyces palmae TaxID=1701085 RepID=A0A4Z0HFI0_9ACTN|nr:hypothetical protein E4099_02450 [Streptomyces palmae]
MLQLLNRIETPSWRRALPTTIVLFLLSVPLSLGVALTAGVSVHTGLVAAATGIAVATLITLHRLTHIRVAVTQDAHGYLVRFDGQLTFLAVARMTTTLARVPDGIPAVVELGGHFMDHSAYDALQSWSKGHQERGGRVTISNRAGQLIAEPPSPHTCHHWTPWRNHQHTSPAEAATTTGGGQLLDGLSAFQRNTAPLVRDELARLAQEGQRPTQLFLTCADSRLVTSMITSSGPGDLFTVRNIGNLMPPPGSETSCDSVAAAIEYAVDVLGVSSLTVCGHSDCGAMQALLGAPQEPGAQTPLARWLRHGRPSLARMQRISRLGRGEVALAERPVADDAERLALVNVMQQLDHLAAHPCVARRVADGSLTLQGMYFHVGEAQAYVLDRTSNTFSAVRPGPVGALDAVHP